MIATHQIVLLALLVLCLPSTSTASGCHGMSKFRLAPAIVESRSAASGSSTKKKAGANIINKSLKEKNNLCEEQYGEGATLMDLEQMEGEFQNPSDLKHALNPLFKENPDMVYLIANHGDDHDENDNKYILKAHLHPTTTTGQEGEGEKELGATRVAGEIFLETKKPKKQQATEEEEEENYNDDEDDDQEAEILCYIPKPKYSSSNMMSMTTSSSHSVQEKTSSSSWMVPLLSLVAVAAVGVAAFQTYKAKTIAAAAAHGGSIGGGPSMDLGGTYSMLSSNEQDLAEQLAPSSTELV